MLPPLTEPFAYGALCLWLPPLTVRLRLSPLTEHSAYGALLLTAPFCSAQGRLLKPCPFNPGLVQGFLSLEDGFDDSGCAAIERGCVPVAHRRRTHACELKGNADKKLRVVAQIPPPQAFWILKQAMKPLQPGAPYPT